MKNFIIILSILVANRICAQTNYSYYGSSLTPKGDLHVLIVFVGFDNTTSADDIIDPSGPDWLHDQLPEWAQGDFNDVIDIDNSQIGVKHNLTDYFYSMSQGNFTITGEIYPDQVQVTPFIVSGAISLSTAFQDAVAIINT